MTIYRVTRTSEPCSWDEDISIEPQPCPEAFQVPCESWLGNYTGWAVDLPDLEALEEFTDRHGRCVIEARNGKRSIEIYDDWRE
jgi:hypothetical protein